MNENHPIFRIGNSLRQLNQQFYNAARSEAERFGITPIQFMGLFVLKKHPMIGLGEFSELMYISPSTASGVIKRLTDAGLVLQERPEENRRALVLKLSESGETILRKANESIMQKLSCLMDLSDEEVEQLLRLHGRLLELLRKC